MSFPVLYCKALLLIYLICNSLCLGKGNGTLLQYSCLSWMEEPGGLQSMGSLRAGHDWVTSLSLFTFMHWRRKWQRTPVFLPGESQGRRSLVGCRLWGHTVRHDWSDLAAVNLRNFISTSTPFIQIPYFLESSTGKCLEEVGVVTWV